MDRARTVLNLINLFDSTDREIIMENINYGMPDLAGWRTGGFSHTLENQSRLSYHGLIMA